MGILADAGYQGLGAQTGGRVLTPPHRKFKKNAPDWYEEMYERQRKAHSSRRIRVEHGIVHLKNWRALARHLGRREHMSDTDLVMRLCEWPCRVKGLRKLGGQAAE
ncbi:transposase family protein [Streptomyces sp. A1499]|uniref:transposase family protein n=1 Tax=Streptomyces sp. A1499 TaxID=2563104 RepID=UPI001F103030|nr:transposase family protein [Streptomyces sp. A1499]